MGDQPERSEARSNHTERRGCTVNEAQVVRLEMSHEGARVKLWIDDERGEHLAVAMLSISAPILESWLAALRIEQDHRDQQTLTYE